MPTPFTSSGHGSGVGSAGAPHNGSRSGAVGNVGLAIDNMLRNQLRISDPRDPKQIAQGLASYYQDLPQTAAIGQGKAAPAGGLDPTNRDKVIAMRRQLGEYARMARFVGSMSPGMVQNFRRLGRGLDEVSAV